MHIIIVNICFLEINQQLIAAAAVEVCFLLDLHPEQQSLFLASLDTWVQSSLSSLKFEVASSEIRGGED